MKTMQSISRSIVATFAIGAATLASAQVTSQVYQVQFLLNGLRAADAPPALNKKVSVTSNTLISLAGVTNPPSLISHQALVLIIPNDAPGARLAVYDTTTGKVLALLATASSGSVPLSATQNQFTSLLTFAHAGSTTSAVNGGNLMLAGTVTKAANGQISKATATVTGWLDITVTDSGRTQQQTVVIPKGVFSVAKVLGTLVETGNGSGNTVSIEGQVYCSGVVGGNGGVANAVVSTSLDSQTATTDANGYFTLLTATPAHYCCTPYTITVTPPNAPAFSRSDVWGDHPTNQVFNLLCP